MDYQFDTVCHGKRMSSRQWLTILLTVAIALTINLAMFGLMPYLLNRNNDKTDLEQMLAHINVIRLQQQETPVQRKVEKKIDPPPEQKRPKPQAPKPVPQKLTLPFVLNPRLPQGPDILSLPDLPAAAVAMNALDGIFSTGELDAPLAVLVRIPPVYPLRAKNRGIEGWVRVRFIVNEDGYVENVKVEEAQPPGIFDESVIRSVSGWRFQAGTISGIPVRTQAETTVHFNLN